MEQTDFDEEGGEEDEAGFHGKAGLRWIISLVVCASHPFSLSV